MPDPKASKRSMMLINNLSANKDATTMMMRMSNKSAAALLRKWHLMLTLCILVRDSFGFSTTRLPTKRPKDDGRRATTGAVFDTSYDSVYDSKLILVKGKTRRRLGSRRYMVSSFFGSWFFKGDNDDGDEEDNDATTKDKAEKSYSSKGDNTRTSSSSRVSSNSKLGGVVSVMEQMDNLKVSQRMGVVTNNLLQELSTMSIEGVSSDGRVKVYLDGQQRPLRVEIDEQYFAVSEPYEVASSCLDAMTQAHTKSIEKMDDKLKSFYKELGLS